MAPKKTIFDGKKHVSPDHPAYKKIDHLKYLKIEPSLFGEDDEDDLGRILLLCAQCGHLVTKASEKIEVFGLHEHSFTNLGYLVEVGCFRNASGCIGTNRISTGYSWFRGYAWQVAGCRACAIQLGWQFTGDAAPAVFFGLIRSRLADRKT